MPATHGGKQLHMLHTKFDIEVLDGLILVKRQERTYRLLPKDLLHASSGTQNASLLPPRLE